jgi:nucleotide-binding universal stress UspA family protein
MISKILVPVDFGEASAAAVALAGRLAAGCDATMTLLHAESVDAPVYFTPHQVSTLAAEHRRRLEQARGFLDEFGRAHTRSPFLSRVVARRAIDAIEAFASEVDLVVIGTHARTGPKRWWLGSVAERVLRDLTVPVMVVHAGDAAAVPIRAVAVHAAPGLSGQNALDLATRIGRAFGADVHDRRAAPLDAGAAFADVSLVVIAEPEPHDRVWRATVGEPLIRSGRGPVLFVPDRAV